MGAVKLTMFIPTRRGSQRVQAKNTRPFADRSGGLLEIKLRQVLKAKCCERVIVSTDDDRAMEIAQTIGDERVVAVRRPQALCESTTPVRDLIEYIPTLIDTGNIFWIHATSPLVGPEEYDRAAHAFFIGGCWYRNDSAISVTRHQQFWWDATTNGIRGRARGDWPNTQDLPEEFEINHAFYIIGSETMKRTRDRVGDNAILVEIPKHMALDIDTEQDFEAAEVLYRHRRSKGTEFLP